MAYIAASNFMEADPRLKINEFLNMVLNYILKLII